MADEITNTGNETPKEMNSNIESDYSLKWQKEISLHVNLDTTIIVEGNINDEQVYKSGDSLMLASTDAYLYSYLHEIGYKTVVFFNHVQGFFNDFDLGKPKAEQELERFKKIVKKVPKDGEQPTAGQQIIDSLFMKADSPSSRFGCSLEDIRAAMNNTEEPVAIILCDVSRYISNPSTISDSDHYFYSRLSLATKKITVGEDWKLHNIMFLLAEKANDIPAWFYLGNPLVKVVTIPKPDMNVRETYINQYYSEFDLDDEEDTPETKARNKAAFVAYTDGFTIRDLNSLRILMNKENIPLSKINMAVSKFKYGFSGNPWEDDTLRKGLKTMEQEFTKRVKGQDAAVEKASSIIKTAVLGLAGLQHSSSKSKPRGVMFMAGPTGVGKTELAKAISEWVFKSDTNVIRFDMSEYSEPHTDQKLLGAPPGYVGYEEGGQLTEAIKRQPFSVLLFDEIEKAHPSILDKFLQILEDGRMTDGKGETVYFSDCLIIFTSNLGILKDGIDQFGKPCKVPVVRYGEDGCNATNPEEFSKLYDEYSAKIFKEIKAYFVNEIKRPEILNRIGENFLIFNYISKDAAVLIANKQMSTIKRNLLATKNIKLELSDEAEAQFIEKIRDNSTVENGGRGVGNTVENMILRPLGRYMSDNEIFDNATIIVKGFKREKGNYTFICD